MSTEFEQREKVVEELKKYLGTRYHHLGRSQPGGAGVDCATLILQAFIAACVVPEQDLPFYPFQFNQHSDNPVYLDTIGRFAHQVEGRNPLLADILVYKFGRCVSHGAAVIDPARMLGIHAWRPSGKVELVDLNKPPLGLKRYVGLWSVW